MKKLHPLCIPENIQEYISLQVRKLLRSSYYTYQDKEDIEQELILFYLEKLQTIPQNSPQYTEGFFYTSIERTAINLLRSKRRNAYYSWKNFCEEEFNPSYVDYQKSIEDKDEVNNYLKGLKEKDQKILIMIMEGSNIREIAQKLKVSKNTIYKILQNLKKT